MSYDMRTHLRHRPCKAEVVATTRTVVSEPEDKGWPRDLTVRVPYCATCCVVVGVEECYDERLKDDEAQGNG